MAGARVPIQERGKLRVETLLDAAESVIAERGYDAATMTEIAARAGASIGSLYQYFRTKTAVADMLRSRLWDALSADLSLLSGAAPGGDAGSFAERLIATLSGFYRRRPALQSIAEARLLPPSVTADVRQRLRREIAVAIQAFSPGIAKDRAETAAVVVYELMKSARLIETEPRLRHRASAASDIKSTLESYLASLAREAVARG